MTTTTSSTLTPTRVAGRSRLAVVGIAALAAWTIVATTSCVLSLGSPLTGGIGTGAKLGLASLHLLVGTIVILGLRRTTLTAAERCRPTT